MNTQTLVIVIILLAGLYFISQLKTLQSTNENLHQTVRLMKNTSLYDQQATAALTSLGMQQQQQQQQLQRQQAQQRRPRQAVIRPRKQRRGGVTTRGSQKSRVIPLLGGDNYQPLQVGKTRASSAQAPGFGPDDLPPWEVEESDGGGSRRGVGRRETFPSPDPQLDDEEYEPEFDDEPDLGAALFPDTHNLSSAGYEPINPPRGGVSATVHAQNVRNRPYF